MPQIAKARELIIFISFPTKTIRNYSKKLGIVEVIYELGFGVRPVISTQKRIAPKAS